MIRIKSLSAITIAVSLLFSMLPAVCALSAETDNLSYTVGPGDILEIFVWKEPELTREVTVMPDGRITFPLIGEVMTQGQTLTSLKEAITEKLKNFVDVPEVTVIVKESRSQRVYVVGKVARPGPYTLDSELTVLQALSIAGGFTEWADRKNVLVVRREGGKEIKLRFNYKRFIAGSDLGQNIILRPNDTIVVP